MKFDEKACPECAEPIKRAAKVCKHCGHRLTEEEHKADLAKLGEENKNIAVGCGAILVLFLVVWAAGIGQEKKAESQYDKTFMMEVEAKNAVRAILKDPNSAKFSGWKFNIGAGVACGRVNSKNSFGGYAGNSAFIVRSGVALLEENVPVGDRSSVFAGCGAASERDNLSR